MKKQFAIIALGLIMGATVLESCKKGENDPGISFRSRKGRLAGDWKCTKADGTQSDGSQSDTWTYDGTNVSGTVVIGANSFPYTQAVTMEILIEKDGTFKSTTVLTGTSNTQTIVAEGTWNFTAGVGEDKKKDHFVTRTLKETTTNSSPSSTSAQTYTGDDAPSTVYKLDRLANKEFVIKHEGTDSDGTTTTTTKENYTYTAK